MKRFLKIFFMCLFFFPDSTGAGERWVNYFEDEVILCLAYEGNFIWAGTENGLYQLDKSSGNALHYTISDGMLSRVVKAVAVDHDGNKWIGTSQGANKFDGNTWTTYTSQDGLADDYINTIFVDTAGNKWFGTKSGGVSRLDSTNWLTYNTGSGLIANDVTAIANDSSGNIWFGTSRWASRFDGTEWTTFSPATGMVSRWINAIAVDPKGNVWFGAGFDLSGGVSKFDGTHFTNYEDFNGLAHNHVRSVAIEGDTVWFGTGFDVTGGVSRFDGTTWKTYTTEDGLAGYQVNAVLVDPDGEKWFGTQGGLSRMSVETITSVSGEQKLPGAYSLHQNFPNPFNPATTISYELPQRTHVTLQIYNIPGQEVRTFVSNQLPAGYHKIHWDGRNNAGVQLPSGVYFYRLTAGNFIQTRKMVLMK